jgi:diguanylate cyclase (GGDEF)-like protein
VKLRITDPLTGIAPDAGTRALARFRLAGALLFGCGGVTLAAVLTAPDPDPSDHGSLLICAAVLLVVAAGLAAWRDIPEGVLHLICPLGTVATAIATGIAEPVGLTPIFFLLPMLVGTYFLPRAEVAANYVFALLCCGLAFALWVDPGLRLAMFMAVALITAVVTVVVLVLRDHVLRLVTRLGELATHDSLTGALNRGAFEQRLEAELARTERMAAPCALVVLDVDHFKRINDTLGHAAGDEALRALAVAVATAKRRSDVFGRIGGEEFAVVLPDTGLAGATTFAEKLRGSLGATMGAVTVSFGVTDARTAGRTVRGMLHSADVALYDAKRAGRDRVVTAHAVRPWGRSSEAAPMVAKAAAGACER